MEGAGSLRLANWLYNVGPKDGTVMGTIGRGTAFDPLLGSKGAQFEADKFTWIGSANNEVSICVAWKTSGITKFEDVLTKELIVGGTGQAADTDQFPQILNGVLGTKFKVVAGYPGGNDVTLAMERGEVKGRCGWSWSSVLATHKRWIGDKSINILIQLSLAKHPDLPDVPLVMDYAKTEEQKQIFQLIFARQVMGRLPPAEDRRAGLHEKLPRRRRPSPPGGVVGSSPPPPRRFSRRPGFRRTAQTRCRKLRDTQKKPVFLLQPPKPQRKIHPVAGGDGEAGGGVFYPMPEAPVGKRASATLKIERSFLRYRQTHAIPRKRKQTTPAGSPTSSST